MSFLISTSHSVSSSSQQILHSTWTVENMLALQSSACVFGRFVQDITNLNEPESSITMSISIFDPLSISHFNHVRALQNVCQVMNFDLPKLNKFQQSHAAATVAGNLPDDMNLVESRC